MLRLTAGLFLILYCTGMFFLFVCLFAFCLVFFTQSERDGPVCLHHKKLIHLVADSCGSVHCIIQKSTTITKLEP